MAFRKYRIKVLTLEGVMIHFFVDTYEVVDGFVIFVDLKDGLEKKFATDKCEIVESINHGR